jgi:hypothetical protein
MIAIFNPETNFCALFTTKTGAAKALNLNPKTIERSIKSKKPTRDGMYCFQAELNKSKTKVRSNNFS